MAKFKLEEEIGELSGLHYNYDPTSMELGERTEKTLEVSDFDGDRVVYTGTDFAFDGDTATSGKVKKVEFFNGQGDLLLTISGASYDLTEISLTSVQANFYLFEKGNDTFTGSSVGDWIMYGDNKGDDKIFGLGGNDYILGSDGRNTIDGGEGDRDVLTYSMVFDADIKGIRADLSKGEVLNPWGKKDSVSGIEDVRGTTLADSFVGTKKDEYFGGLEGNDSFRGGKGVDTFDFAAGMDKDRIIDFGLGDDHVELAGFGLSTFSELKKLMAQKGDDVVVDFGDGDVLTFLDFKKGDFAKGDFTIYNWE